MCGICGVMFKNSAEKKSYKNKTKIMCAHMRDRGPDSNNIWSGASAIMGHTRLAIMDPENHLADQPIQSENWVLVFNGEIYNFRELRRKLEAKGLRFETDSDTEVLLLHIEKYGVEKTLSVLNGIFSFCAYEKNKRRAHLVRDRLGVKPLYFWLDSNRESFWFSSTPASIVEASSQVWNLDRQAVFSFFHLGAPSTRGTFFQGINRLRPAEYIIVDHDLKIREKRYWKPEFREGDLEETVTEIILKEKEAHVDSAVFLSGGIDSSVMATVLSDVQAFHLNSPELKYAEYVSEKLKIPLKVKDYVNDINFDELLTRYSVSSGEASASSPIPLMVAELITAEGFKVAFSANGADELFLGYPRTTVPELKAEACTALDYEQVSVQSDDEQYYHIFRDESAITIPGLEEVIDKNCVTDLYGLNELDPEFSDSASSRWFELQTYVGCDLNPTLDFASMSCSLEVRVPFLNHELVEVALSHDGNFFISADYGRKKPLKKMLKNYGFHPSLWSRNKIGFSIPEEVIRKKDEGMDASINELKGRHLFKLGVSQQNYARDYIYLNSAIHAFNIWSRVWIDSGKVSS